MVTTINMQRLVDARGQHQRSSLIIFSHQPTQSCLSIQIFNWITTSRRVPVDAMGHHLLANYSAAGHKNVLTGNFLKTIIVAEVRLGAALKPQAANTTA